MSVSGFNEVMELFVPGYRHQAEEKDRRRLTAQIPGSEGDPLGVDLDKGIVRISRPKPKDATGDKPPPEPKDPTGDNPPSA